MALVARVASGAYCRRCVGCIVTAIAVAVAEREFEEPAARVLVRGGGRGLGLGRVAELFGAQRRGVVDRRVVHDRARRAGDEYDARRGAPARRRAREREVDALAPQLVADLRRDAGRVYLRSGLAALVAPRRDPDPSR